MAGFYFSILADQYQETFDKAIQKIYWWGAKEFGGRGGYRKMKDGEVDFDKIDDNTEESSKV